MDKYTSKINVSDNEISVIFGELDVYAKMIEKSLDIAIIPRDDYVKIVGNKDNVISCERVIYNLIESYKKGYK